jgi:hypothetical protein
MLRAINEWQPLLSATRAEYHVAHLPFFYDLSVFGIFFGLAIALILAPSADDLPLFAIAAVLIVAAFAQVRNVPLGMIAAIPPLAHHATLALESRRNAPDVVAPPHRQGLVGQAVVVIVALALSAQTGLFSRRLALSEQYPAGALAFMRSKGLFGNLLCEYSWSDYVIFHDAPRDRVFIDSRFEMIYPRRIIEAYLDFSNNRAGAARTLAGFPNDFVLLDPETPAENLMAHAAGWARIYSDRYSVLYAPRGSRAAGLAGIPVRGRSVAPGFP